MPFRVHFSMARAFSLVGAITFNNIPRESERHVTSSQLQLRTTNASGQAANALGKARKSPGVVVEEEMGGCAVQRDSGLACWWQHQNLTSHAFSQQSPLHVMCWEMKSICFERLTLKLDVLRLAETVVTGSNNASEGEELGSREWGSSDSPASQVLFCLSPFC